MEFPPSDRTINVYIIDTTTRISNLPSAAFTLPDIPGNEIRNNGVSYSFLLERKNPDVPGQVDNLLFDLGVRKDLQNSPTVVLEQGKQFGLDISVTHSVFDILKNNGKDPAEINSIVWSHCHMDHTGDPSEFPETTSLVVGPGFKKSFIPAWPTDANSAIDEKAWKNRELTEISFDEHPHRLRLGQYKAIDFFGDGSLYLLDSPGHVTAHISALVRTSANPPEFMFLGGDVAHHGSEFRPTQQLPLPKEIQPNPLLPPFAKTSLICPGSIFESLHPKKSSTEPFVQARGFIHEDPETACASVEKLFDFDALDNVFVVIAHDHSLQDVVDFYPKPANEWKQKGWKEQGRWRFLRDFDTGIEQYAPS